MFYYIDEVYKEVKMGLKYNERLLDSIISSVKRLLIKKRILYTGGYRQHDL
jgi:hypothetical protein